MRARGLPREIDLVRVAAEARRVLVDPDDGAPDLIGHDADVATGRFDRDKIGRNIMRARPRDVLRREMVFLGAAVLPGAAMGENENRRVWAVDAEDVELLDVGGTIRVALRIA